MVFGIAFLALAVAAPNFSGVWIRDKTKSDPLMMGRRGGGEEADVEVTLTIQQADNNFEVARQMGERTATSKYTLDGKENTNTMGRGEAVSKSKWDGDKLAIEGTRKFSGPNGEMEMQFREVYALSPDGKVLTVTSTMTSPRGERTSKQVYNKK